MIPAVSTRRIAIAALALVVAAFALRLYRLDAFLFLDESIHLTWGRGYQAVLPSGVTAAEMPIRLPPRPLGEAMRVVHEHAPPLCGAMVNLWTRVSPPGNDFVLKLPWAALGALAVLGIFLAAREAHGEAAGLWAAALVAASPFHVYHAQEVNHYAAATCAAAFALWLHFRWVRGGRLRDGALLGAALVLAVAGHYHALLLAAFLGLAVVWERRRTLRGLVLAGWPYLLPLVAVIADLRGIRAQLADSTPASYGGAYGGLPYLARQSARNAFTHWMGTAGEHGTPMVAGLLLLAFVAALWVHGVRRSGGPGVRSSVIAAAVGPFLVISAAYLLTARSQVLWPRYGILFSLVVYLPVAAALASIRAPARWAAGAVLAAALGYGLHHHFRVHQKEHYREAAAVVDAGYRPGAALIIFQPTVEIPLSHYLRSDIPLYPLVERPRAEESVREIAAGRDEVWLLTSWDDGLRAGVAARDSLAAVYRERRDWTFPWIRLTRFGAAASAAR